MKRLLSFFMILVLIFSLSACGKKEEKKSENSVDIEYYAKLGKIPESDYSLGEDVEKVKEELSSKAQAAEDHNVVYSVMEGENNVLIDNGDICYYYKKANPQDGVSYIVNYDTAFGFENGTVIIQIKEALKDYKYIEEAMTEDNAFFMFDINGGSVIKCDFGENTVLFAFKDNALCATAIYVTNVW